MNDSRNGKSHCKRQAVFVAERHILELHEGAQDDEDHQNYEDDHHVDGQLVVFARCGGSSIPQSIKILIDFVTLGVFSLLIGIATGLFDSYIFKRMRFLTHSGNKETLLIFCFVYLAYSGGELAGQSGIICPLTIGVVMAYYSWYNLFPQGKIMSSASFQVIGFALEAFVF